MPAPAAPPPTVPVRARAGRTLLEAAQGEGQDLPTGCRVGTCGTCAVRVRSGEGLLQPPDALEALSLQRHGFAPEVRLACRARASADGELAVTPE